ncbi:MAG: L-seryl-tRNA(Sec) selenium transferase [Proteobacteria bacterium]|nr:L-seryl-tRNA(Sec) selenium transferase [Pseudomonadota bacterium]
MTDPNGALRSLPSIDRLLGDAEVLPLLERFPRAAVVEALRDASTSIRQRLKQGEAVASPLNEAIVEVALTRLGTMFSPGLTHVVNATGVVIHTNLGRAVLAPTAVEAARCAAEGYINLEYDLSSGQRGRRAASLIDLICSLTGAEDACVVNNNAAAVLLILDTLARGREVVVSRSELIEIGGAFRLPEVLARSGATLVEVGTTNKTYPRDYVEALTERTALLMKSHWSNFRIIGFVREVSVTELAAIGREKGVATALDLGSGALVDFTRLGLPHEPTVRACVEAGLDLVCFSGDKLLGGPQAGIIVGRRDAVSRCARNPLMRALRCDKMTLAALEATLLLYRDAETVSEKVPVLAMLTAPLEALEQRARGLAARLVAALGDAAQVDVTEGTSLPGGGSLPAHELPTWRVTLRAGCAEDVLVARLRRARTPVVARAESGCVAFDVRTLLQGDEERIVAACQEAIS